MTGLLGGVCERTGLGRVLGEGLLAVGSGAAGFLVGVARYIFFCLSADGIGDSERPE